MKKILIYLFGIIVFVLSAPDLHASHIVGGEMTYRHISGRKFEIRLSLRRDCFNGSVEAQFDDPANIAIYNSEGKLLNYLGFQGILQPKFNNDDTLNEILKTECEVIGGDVCVHTTTYIDTVELPFLTGGYLFVYQRCCRNKTLTNVLDPEFTGATYTLRITEDALRYNNSSPKFVAWPPIYICGDRPLVFNHSAIDAEGDSIVYSLCAPYQGGDTSNSKPTVAARPPYKTIVYRQPYSLFNLLGNSPALAIDRNTGILTGTPDPTVTGQYLVGVCMSEFRNGRLLSEIRRDFQYNVRICTTNPVAQFSPDAHVKCEGDLTVAFKNNSVNAKDYTWIFDYPFNNIVHKVVDTTITYPKAGKYRVALIATRQTGCIDTNIQNIYLYDSTLLKADFDFNFGSCDQTIDVNFNDKSFDSLLSIKNWDWSIQLNGNVYKAVIPSPSFSLQDTGLATVTLIITSEGGCLDTITKQLRFNRLKPSFIGPIIPICIGESTRLINIPDNRFQYTWAPSSSLSCDNCPDPVASPTQTTTYYLTITDGNCTEYDSVLVKVSTLLDIDISGDHIICSDTSRLLAIGGVVQTIEWSNDPTFANVIKRGDFSLTSIVNDSMIFYVRGKSGANCPGGDSITVYNEKVKFKSSRDDYKFCEQDTFELELKNERPEHQLVYNWQPEAMILSGQGSSKVTASVPSCHNQDFVITAQNQHLCTTKDTVPVSIICKPKADYEVLKNCDNTLVSFINRSETGNYTWDFGDQTTSNEKDPIHFYNKTGIYIVTLSVQAECFNQIKDTVNVGFIMLSLNDTVLSCQGTPVYLNPNPDPKFTYTWSPEEGLNDPNIPNPLSSGTKSRTYNVRITDPSIPDCYIDRKVTVYVPPDIDLRINHDTVLCYSHQIVLQAKTSVLAKIEWVDEVGLLIGTGYTLEKEINDSMFVYSIATDIYGCSELDSFRVIPVDTRYRIEGKDRLCPGTDGFIQFIPENSHRYKVNWSPGSIVNSPNSERVIVKPIDTTIYYIDFVNEYGCAYRDSFQVNISKFEPPLEAYAEDDTIFLSQSTVLHVNRGYKNYIWVLNYDLSCSTCTDPIAMPKASTRYTVKATNEDGCEESTDVTVIVIRPNCDESDVYIPNIFSPNGDSKNDEFRIQSNFVKKVHMEIYNRWGQKVFESDNPSVGWDGKFEGRELPPDVYGYFFSVLCIDEKEYFKKGNVTLVR